MVPSAFANGTPHDSICVFSLVVIATPTHTHPAPTQVDGVCIPWHGQRTLKKARTENIEKVWRAREGFHQSRELDMFTHLSKSCRVTIRAQPYFAHPYLFFRFAVSFSASGEAKVWCIRFYHEPVQWNAFHLQFARNKPSYL